MNKCNILKNRKSRLLPYCLAVYIQLKDILSKRFKKALQLCIFKFKQIGKLLNYMVNYND